MAEVYNASPWAAEAQGLHQYSVPTEFQASLNYRVILCPKNKINTYTKRNHSKDRSVSTTESKSRVCRAHACDSSIWEVEIRGSQQGYMSSCLKRTKVRCKQSICGNDNTKEHRRKSQRVRCSSCKQVLYNQNWSQFHLQLIGLTYYLPSAFRMAGYIMLETVFFNLQGMVEGSI